VELDPETKRVLGGIDSMVPLERAAACDSLEIALGLGTDERRAAVAARVVGSPASGRLVALLIDPFAEVKAAAASAVRALCVAGGPSAVDALAAKGAQTSVLAMFAGSAAPADLVAAFRAAAVAPPVVPAAEDPDLAAAAAVAVPITAVPVPASGLARLSLVRDAASCLAELVRGSSSAASGALAVATTGEASWPADASLPVGGVLGPVLACLELPPQARAAGQWDVADAAAAPGLPAAREAALEAQEAAAEALHTLCDDNAELAAAVVGAGAAGEAVWGRWAAVMVDSATSGVASLHTAGAVIGLCASAAEHGAALPGPATAALRTALGVVARAVSLPVVGPAFGAALAARAEAAAAKARMEGAEGATGAGAASASSGARPDLLAVGRQEAAEEAAEEAGAAAAAMGGAMSAGAALIAEAEADERAVYEADAAAAAAVSHWRRSGPEAVALAAQVLSTAVSGGYMVRGAAAAEGGPAASVDVRLTSASEGVMAGLAGADVALAADGALLSLTRLLNGEQAAAGDAAAAAILTEAWARAEVVTAAEALGSLRATMAHAAPPADPAAVWARLGPLLQAADWRPPAGSAPAVAVARGIAGRAALPSLLAAAQAAFEAAAEARAAGRDAEAVPAASALAALAPALCATAAEGASSAASGGTAVTSSEARALALACLSQLPALSPASMASPEALGAVAAAVIPALHDPSLEVVAEALNCAFDVFGADGEAVTASAKSSGIAARIAEMLRPTAAKLAAAGGSVEPDAAHRCHEMLENGARFVEYLRGTGAA